MTRRPGLLATVLAAAVLSACTPQQPTQSAPPPVATSTPATSTSTGTTSSAPSQLATPSAWPRVALVKRWAGLHQPLDVKAVPGTKDRVAIVEQVGQVRLASSAGVAPEVFLDVSGEISSGGERGLLGIAFAPSYQKTGRFYIYYTATSGDVTISRLKAAPGGKTADPRSETVVLKVPHLEFPNHNGGGMQFGPDGYLYAGLGDGGSEGDPNGNGQNRKVLLAKLLRIDVEGTGTTVPNTYEIPKDNPFATAGGGVRPEIWSYGLRNPWRFSFDAATGDLYIGDVGQNLWEEVDHAAAGDRGGENYGWNLWEGNHPYPPGTSRSRAGFTFPVTEYPHPTGQAITGGYVYRGSRYPALAGTYYYGDYVTGKLWGLRGEKGRWVSNQLLNTSLGISSFGEDGAGELYACDLNGGAVYQLTAK